MRFVLLATSLASLAGIVLAKPEKIRGVTDPVYHLYLQAYPKDKSIPVLGPEASAEFFNIAGTIQSTNSSSYLNIGSDATSYKTLQLSNASGTSAWGLEGDTIITTQSSSWGRQLRLTKFGRVEFLGVSAGYKLLATLSSNREQCANWEELQQLSDDPSALPLLDGFDLG
ncbi:hypothetical protein CSAL01_09254 [Colletotrichum salicis]|uniref:Uncharacterized protein n=1 Tax=Colletotrichum salicis TaxID=1209931 RepID=A0A135UZF5_9PEZI|nr:hypothetical protein CSAL01_09254 [Colletotrichum salicis]